MSTCSCHYKSTCIVFALIASIIVGIIASFLQITAAITITPVILWVLFASAVALFAILLLSSVLAIRLGRSCDQCAILDAILAGVLGTILFALILLTTGIVATSILTAILIGLLLFSYTLALTSLACYIRCTLNCDN